jgi:hypothetical protein
MVRKPFSEVTKAITTCTLTFSILLSSSGKEMPEKSFAEINLKSNRNSAREQLIIKKLSGYQGRGYSLIRWFHDAHCQWQFKKQLKPKQGNAIAS